MSAKIVLHWIIWAEITCQTFTVQANYVPVEGFLFRRNDQIWAAEMQTVTITEEVMSL